MSVTIKFCGLTGPDDAHAAAQAGADYLGFVFFTASPRVVGPSDVPWIRALEGTPKVGVFRDQDPEWIARLRQDAGLALVQLHGHESPAMCAGLGGRERVIKALGVGEVIDWRLVLEYARVARVLFDTGSPSGGGTGQRFDWDLLAGAPAGLEFWLAGGLTPANVAGAIARVKPAGVDVASGVETAVGRKDADKMKSFVAAVRSAPVGTPES
jgi:phosphoribosylanthranilate isomerase